MKSLFLLGLAQAALALAPQPSPVEKMPHYLLGKDLLQRCDGWAAGPDYCYGYVTSVYDTVRAYEAWLKLNEMCVPAGTSQGELVSTVVSYIRSSPSNLESQAASLVVVALQQRYPCASAPREGNAPAARSQ